jgi:hypothetical protein
MIVGTYFIGGLVLFFLFAWNFLESIQNANNKTDLKNFTAQLENNFVLNRSGDRVIRAEMKKAREQGSWQRLRMPLFFLLSAVGIFVFLTQDAIYQKMTGLLTSVEALVPLISQFFNKSDK